jgi:hypothetical protein
LKKWAQKLNCKTSDKEAEKVLKAHNLKIQWWAYILDMGIIHKNT